jgi:carbon monoxide dehydrogenase subunit G
MTVSVDIELGYEFAVKAPSEQVFALLADVPLSASHFPQVDRLVDLGHGAYRWELQRVGTPQVGIQTVYACKYVSDAKKGAVTWTPVKGVGNAQLRGSWKVTGRKGRTRVVFRTRGTIGVAMPTLMRAIVVPVVEAEFERLVEKYIDNLIETFGGEVE